MKVVIAGASGLIGSALSAALSQAGHRVVRLVREGAAAGGGDRMQWDPQSGQIDPAALEGCDAVVNLAGESIAAGRWTAAKKKRILESRVRTTETLVGALAAQPVRPRTLVNASAVGYYGSRGDEPLDESSSGGGDFLSEVCRTWEAATAPAVECGARVVLARFGVVLAAQGGALAKMLLPFRLGLGGVIGSGRQWMSWVTLDDAVGAIIHALVTDELRGPMNVVAPEPVTNRQFTRTLGKVLSRPTILPLPAFAARAVMGQMADELLLVSQRVEPARLAATGYVFKFPELETALRHVLHKQ